MRPLAMIGVSTCLRDNVDYLPDTLVSLENAGATAYPKIVFSDGPITKSPRGWSCIATEQRKSSRLNLWAAIRMAVNIGAERLLFFEDDLRATQNAVHRMATVEIPKDTALVSFYDMKEVPSDSRPGLYRSPARGRDGKGFWSLLGTVFPRWMLEYLAAKDPFSVQKDVPHMHGDRTIEDLMAASPWPSFCVHIPCLVRHVGEVSAAHPGAPFAKRHTRNYPGDLFDARQLITADESKLNTLVAVTTSPRPQGLQYLTKTLTDLSLEGAGAHPTKIVVSDGQLDASCPWPAEVMKGPSGTKKALWRLFMMAASMKVDRLVFFEDDIEPCRNAVTRVLGQPSLPGLGCTSYFDYRNLAADSPPGFYLVGPKSAKGGPMWGIQATSVSGEVVEYLARVPQTLMEKLKGFEHGSDTLLTDVLRAYSPYHVRAQHSPCLFEHIGGASTWGNQQMHKATVWKGKEFDALSLPVFGEGTEI